MINVIFGTLGGWSRGLKTGVYGWGMAALRGGMAEGTLPSAFSFHDRLNIDA